MKRFSTMLPGTTLAVLLCGTVASAESIADTAWPMFQHDMQRRGQNLVLGPDMERSEILLKADIATGSSSPVIGHDGTAYVGSHDGCLYAVSFDGTVTCLYQTDGPVKAAPILSDSKVLYFGSADGRLYALTADGDLLWDRHLGEYIASSPAFGARGDIIAGVTTTRDQGSVYSLSADGDLLWEHTTGAVSFSSPAVDAYGNIFIGTDTGRLISLSSTGSLRWTFPPEEEPGTGAIISTPVIDCQGHIYISVPAVLIGLNPNGTEKWRFTPMATVFGFEEASALTASPALDQDGRLYLGGVLGDIHCLTCDGTKLWSTMLKPMTVVSPFPASILSPPVLDAKRAYVLSGTTLYSFPASGSEPRNIAQRNLNTAFIPGGSAGGPVNAAPALGPSRNAIVAAADGMLYAVGTSSRQALGIDGTISGIPAYFPSQAYSKTTMHVLCQSGDTWQVPIEPSGRYEINNLRSGSYLLTPRGPGLSFDPPSRSARLSRSNISGVNFNADFGWLVRAVSVTPQRISTDTASPISITVDILSSGSIDDISVTADLRSIDGPPDQPLSPAASGQRGFLFTLNTTVPKGIPLSPLPIPLTVSDVTGRIVQKLVAVIADRNFNGTGISEFTFRLPSGVLLFEIQYSIPDTNMPYSGFLLEAFKPGNTGTQPDYSQTISDEGVLHIESPAQGLWRCRITPQSAIMSMQLSGSPTESLSAFSSSSYTISVSTAGTGAVFGMLTDAETGLPVHEPVEVRTSAGGSSPSSQGLFFFISPAGAFTLTTLDRSGTYAPATRTVHLMSGGTAEPEILLHAGTGISSSCALDFLFGDSELLQPFRLLRDTLLAPNETGRHSIEQFYRHSPEIIELARADAGLRSRLIQCTLSLLPAVTGGLQGDPLRLTQQQTTSILKLLQTLKETGSEELSAAASEAAKQLHTGSLPYAVSSQP